MNNDFVYNPDQTPDPKWWHQLNESRRIEVVTDFHRHHNIKLMNATVHAVMHVVVESQVASGLAPVIETLERLSRGGLDRHESIHAIGSALAAHAHAVVSTPQARSELQHAYFRRLENLCAVRWQQRTA